MDVGAATALDLRLDELLAFDVRPETRQIPGIDTETETEQELEQELELEFELDLEIEAEAEAEAEAEFELETEFESEGEFEAEVEPFGDEEMDSFEGFDFDLMAFGAQRVTEFGTVGEAIGVNGGVGDSDGMAAETAEQILDGPASPSGFDPMPFEGDDMLDLGAPTVTGLDGPAAVPPGGSLPASVENALFDERENRSLF